MLTTNVKPLPPARKALALMRQALRLLDEAQLNIPAARLSHAIDSLESRLTDGPA